MGPIRSLPVAAFGEAVSGAARGGVEELSEARAREMFELLEPTRATRRLRTIPGRETYLIDLGGRLVVVKRTDHDARRELWYERLRRRPVRVPGRREFENLRALGAAGLAVPEPLLWARERGGRSLVVMEHVPHVEDLTQRLARADREERAGWIALLSKLVARLHGAGFYHRDLYLSHVVLHEETGTPVLLDAGRVRWERAPRWRWLVKDLAALYHSRPADTTDSECLRFLGAYRRELDGQRGRARPGELRAWVRRVRRKQRRLAAHRPRFSDARTSRPHPPVGGSSR